MRLPSRFGLLLACILAASRPAMPADEVGEYSLKAAFLYNFAVFTRWPQPAGESFQLCVLGPDPFGPALDALEARAIERVPVRVRRIQQVQAAQSCRVVFISASEQGNLDALAASLAQKGVLTVADSEDAVRSGVMIGLAVENQRVVFDINLRALRRAGLDVSARLLKLAREVL